jgi:hypothetical protein
MNHRNPRSFSLKYYPFSSAQLQQFKRELNKAGGFYSLMIAKQALEERMGMKYITLYTNINRYKYQFLTGVYRSLRPMYDTSMPFIFWSDMYETLQLLPEEAEKPPSCRTGK